MNGGGANPGANPGANLGRLDIPDAGGWPRPPATAVADPAWRRRERRRFRWLIWLTGLSLVSLAGAAALHFLGAETAGPGEIPVLRADPSPVRTRPENPGGREVQNLDKTVYDQLARGAAPRPGGAAGPRVESLLPPPEAPKPLPAAPALPAQRAALTEGLTPEREAQQPEQPAPQTARTAPGAPPPAASPAGPQPAPPPPAPQAAPPHPAPQAAAPPAAVPAGTGRIQVQLAAVATEAAATAEWERLRRRMPDLLANQRPAISRGEREGQPFWRVRTGAFDDNAQARAFCDQVRARGGSCFVAPSG